MSAGRFDGRLPAGQPTADSRRQTPMSISADNVRLSTLDVDRSCWSISATTAGVDCAWRFGCSSR
jgi:hypothetical protein